MRQKTFKQQMFGVLRRDFLLEKLIKYFARTFMHAQLLITLVA